MMVRRSRGSRRDRPVPPLDQATAERLALHYVGRYATTRAKLAAYLLRKVRERGWDDAQPFDADAIVQRFAAAGYVDDAAFAEARSGALLRRGFGARRIAQELQVAGIADADRPDAAGGEEAIAAADRFARRRRIGPYADAPADPATRQRHIAAFIRAGHDFAIARRFVDAAPGEVPAIDPP